MKIQIEKPKEKKLEELGVKSWSIWEHDAGSFPWHYDMTEVCYVLEGKVRVKTDEGTVEFGTGDLVTFPKGLSCEWQIVEPVKKQYTFK